MVGKHKKKVLIVISCIDLNIPLGCTPAWWQLMKGLSGLGVEIICSPYFGPPVSSLWWLAEPNPCAVEAELFFRLRNIMLRFRSSGGSVGGSGKGLGATFINQAIRYRIRPKWQKHLVKMMNRHPDIDMVLVLSVPPNHFRGIPEMISRKFSVPVYFYDGDAPASLPEYGGFASGFRIYENADLGEYNGVICNSEGVSDRLKAMGARQVHTLHWGADPDIFWSRTDRQDIDVGFYGIGERHREEWIRKMIGLPSDRLPATTFTVFGSGFSPGNLGLAHVRPLIPFHNLPRELSRIKIHLNITRTSHAEVLASSSTRLFELAAIGGCIVSNPINGIQRWFSDDELCIVKGADEATAVYTRLLQSQSDRQAIGARARKRVLEEHTYHHRAKQFVRIVGL